MSYGSAGNIDQVLQGLNGGALPSSWPSWLTSQIFKDPSSGQWTYYQNIKDQSGKPVWQLGDSYNQSNILNPSGVVNDPVLGTETPDSNVDHSHDHSTGLWNLVSPAGGLALVGGAGLLGGGLLGDLFGGGTSAAAPGAFDAGGSTGFGGAGFDGLNAGTGYAGAGATSSLPNSYWSALASNGTSDVPLGGAATYDPMAPENLSNTLLQGQLEAPGTAPAANSGLFSQLMNGDISGAGSSLLGSAMSNPLQALGLLQATAGLIHHPQQTGASSSTSKSTTPGASSSLFSSRPQFTPNPNTLAQLRFYGGGGL